MSFGKTEENEVSTSTGATREHKYQSRAECCREDIAAAFNFLFLRPLQTSAVQFDVQHLRQLLDLPLLLLQLTERVEEVVRAARTGARACGGATEERLEVRGQGTRWT